MSNTRRSEIPPAIEKTQSAQTKAAKHPAPAKGDAAKHYNREVRRLLARFSAKLSEKVRAYLLGCVTPGAAIKSGRARSPSMYVGQFIAALDTYAPYIAAKRLPGFGPVRARYGVELLANVAPLLGSLLDQKRDQRVASQKHQAAMSTIDARRMTATAFAAVVSGDAGPDANLSALAPKSKGKGDRMAAAEELTAEIERVQGEVPEELLDDAGLSHAALDALAEESAEVSDTGAVRKDAATTRQLLRAQLAERCGRIRHELMVLLGAVRAARKLDPNVPVFTSTLLRHTSPTSTSTSSEPAPAPAPALAPTSPTLTNG